MGQFEGTVAIVAPTDRQDDLGERRHRVDAGERLADDRAQLPRWGYVIKGRVAFRLADREDDDDRGRTVVFFVDDLHLSPQSAAHIRKTIRRFIDGWNERCQPFVWTKTADEILHKATGGQRSSFTRH